MNEQPYTYEQPVKRGNCIIKGKTRDGRTFKLNVGIRVIVYSNYVQVVNDQSGKRYDVEWYTPQQKPITPPAQAPFNTTQLDNNDSLPF